MLDRLPCLSNAGMNTAVLRARIIAKDNVGSLEVLGANKLSLEAVGVIDIREAELDDTMLEHHQ